MEERDKSDLLKLQAFQTVKYDRYSLTSLTAYCAFWLNEWDIAPSIENVAVASHRMFPSKFAMVGWPDFPDLNRTNRSLLQMRPKYRNLATSVSDKGVFLNHNGVQEARALTEKIGVPVFLGQNETKRTQPIATERGTSKPRTLHPEDALRSLKKSQLFQMYQDKLFGESEAIHLIGLLGVYDHTPSREKRRKLKLLLDFAAELNDQEAIGFLKSVFERFQRYLNK